MFIYGQLLSEIWYSTLFMAVGQVLQNKLLAIFGYIESGQETISVIGSVGEYRVLLKLFTSEKLDVTGH